jgi:hypothetical protein
MQMENISSFLTAATAIGVGSSETFQVRPSFGNSAPPGALIVHTENAHADC